jgi:hypothetical protein
VSYGANEAVEIAGKHQGSPWTRKRGWLKRRRPVMGWPRARGDEPRRTRPRQRCQDSGSGTAKGRRAKRGMR